MTTDSLGGLNVPVGLKDPAIYFGILLVKINK